MERLLNNPVFLVFGFLTITSVVATVASYWYKMRKAELDTALKHEMLQKGMSADDIVKVLQAQRVNDVSPANSGKHHGKVGVSG